MLRTIFAVSLILAATPALAEDTLPAEATEKETLSLEELKAKRAEAAVSSLLDSFSSQPVTAARRPTDRLLISRHRSSASS